MINGSSFTEIAAILGLATVAGVIGQRLRQPLIIMFLATGIIAGPSVLGIIHSYEQIELLADIGISVLLFIVGLKLDLNLIRTTGPVALATGLGQIIFTSVIGFVIALVMGIEALNAAYLAVALTFSSTIIIVKLLSEKKEIDSLHGQIAIGFLIVQDIAAILALVGLTSFGSSIAEGKSAYISILILALKGAGILIGVALVMKYIIPLLVKRLAHSIELLTLFAIAWAIFLGAATEMLGFSKEVGAFLAGVTLASTEYRDSIGGRLASIRDFLLLFFFISLGARLDWSIVNAQIGKSIVFSLFVLIGNPLIVVAIMGVMGYRRRTGFLAGLTVAQISEFSLIVAALGVNLGHISDETMGLITLVGVITIFISTYMILYSGQLYNLLSGPLKIFEKRNPYREAAIDTLKEGFGNIDIILVGLGNYGSGLMKCLLRRNKKIIGVDFDPIVLEKWRKKGVPVIYGDISNQELYEQLPLGNSQWIISTIRSHEINMSLLSNLKNKNYDIRVALTASSGHEAQAFERAGANIVFRPFSDASERAADTLTYAIDFLPENINWPVSFVQVRIRSDSSVVGQEIRSLSLSSLGISILAVSRGGRVYYEPMPDFRIFPADILLIMGPPASLKEAKSILNQLNVKNDIESRKNFEIAEIEIAENSEISDKSIAEIHFRQRYGVTLVGIRRGEEQITIINPSEHLKAGDFLIVIGKSDSLNELKKRAPI